MQPARAHRGAAFGDLDNDGFLTFSHPRAVFRQTRLELNSAVMETGDIDLIDVELCNDREFIDILRAQAQTCGVKLILSYHNFAETPSEHFIYSKLFEAQTSGGDIAKFAAMPKNYGDVLTLLNATQKARNEHSQT